MTRDYYVILGVGDDATLDEIKSAYRREAKKRHPDHSGEGCEPFLALQEAYEVLGDPRRRQAYDERRAREERRAEGARRAPGPEPIRRRRPPAEPLVPNRRSSDVHDPFFGSPVSSLMADLLGRTRSEPGRRTAAAGVEEVRLDVLVSHAEARHGGRVRIGIPVQAACPACRGQGGTYLFQCQHCLGHGTIVEDRPLDIVFPGGLADGSEGRISLRRPGLPDLSLVLRFRIDPR